MDDNHKPSLTDSQFEWAMRLVQILQPLIYDGIQLIFQEAVTICAETEENEKYLMTFQNFLSRIPKWNEILIQKEVDRIVDKSACTYLDDLITCVHIVHLKILTSIRTGKTQKKIDIAIPKLNKFIHRVYTNLSRTLYSNTFLFETEVAPLVFQKNRSEFNKHIKTAILDAVRESIPVEQLLRAYLDETTDLVKEEIKESEKVEIKEEKVPEKPLVVDPKPMVKEPIRAKVDDPILEIVDLHPRKEAGIRFLDSDSAITTEGVTEVLHAPKDIATLESIAAERHVARKLAESDDSDKLQIMDDVSIELPIEVIS